MKEDRVNVINFREEKVQADKYIKEGLNGK
jgi:hypothetical protein